MSQQPNILLIVLDTLRRDRLSTYGHNRETSSSLDAFSAHSTLFERAISPAQWTIPAHTSLFTGLYPSTHQVIQGGSKLSGSYPTLAEILQGAGYNTVAFCNNPLVGVLDNGLRRGFDQFYSYAGVMPNRPVDVQRSALRRMLAARFRRFARRIENHFAHNDDLFRVSMHPLLVPLWTRYINYKGHTERSINDLIDFWHSYFNDGQVEQPLFAFVNLMGAHLPYKPPQDIMSHIAPELRHDRRAYAFMNRFNAEAARWASPPEPPLQDWERDVLRGFYDAEIAHQDQQLGRLLEALRTRGALDNTLVIITADHGESHGDHEFFGHGFVVYQELVHVPMLISDGGQRFPAGKRVQTNVSTRRVFHTVLDAAGIKPPLDEADPNADTARLTLANTTNGRRDTEEDIAFAEAFPPETFLGLLRHRNPAIIERLRLRHVRRGIYDNDHKLTVVGAGSSTHIEGLYNVMSDPTETFNMTDDYPSLAQELKRKLSAFVSDAEHQRAESGATNGEVSPEIVEHLRDLGYLE
jgi:arylsulfatase A-like enzyme